LASSKYQSRQQEGKIKPLLLCAIKLVFTSSAEAYRCYVLLS
jgi:hypothetical protein